MARKKTKVVGINDIEKDYGIQYCNWVKSEGQESFEEIVNNPSKPKPSFTINFYKDYLGQGIGLLFSSESSGAVYDQDTSCFMIWWETEDEEGKPPKEGVSIAFWNKEAKSIDINHEDDYDSIIGKLLEKVIEFGGVYDRDTDTVSLTL